MTGSIHQTQTKTVTEQHLSHFHSALESCLLLIAGKE